MSSVQVSDVLESMSEVVSFTFPDPTVQHIDLEEALRKKVPRTSKKISRNAKCPCGSSKKFKKCCMKAFHIVNTAVAQETQKTSMAPLTGHRDEGSGTVLQTRF